MLVDFDKFGMAEKPVLTLQYPQGIELGQLGSYEDLNYDAVLNSYSTISFKYPYYGNDKIKSNLYDEIVDKMRIEAGGLGSFIICNCEEENDGVNRCKHITANSLEVQMCRRKTNLLNGTYKFYDTFNPDDTLLGLVCRYLPTWHVEYVSEDLEDKWRTFDVPDSTLYDFLMNDVSKAYECMFVFDTVNQGIYAYTTEEMVKDSDIYIGYGNFLKSEKIEEVSDEITTVMSCYGGDGVNIASVNPLGSVFLYNFNHFKPMMSASLAGKIKNWEELLASKTAEYSGYVESLKTKNAELITLKADLRDLQSKLAALEDVQSVRIAAGKTAESIPATTTVAFDANNNIQSVANLIYKVIVAAIHKLKGTTPETGSPSAGVTVTITQPDDSGKIVAVNSSIADLEKRIASKESEIETLAAKQKAINDSLKFSTGTPIGFTEDDLLELEYFKFESTHQDDNYIITDAMSIEQQQDMIQDLYDSCVSLMQQVSSPTYNITADSANFLFIEKLAPFFNRYYDPSKPETLKQLLGIKFHLEKEDGVWIDPVLLKFHVNFDNPTDFSMEFSNKYRLNSAIWTYADLIGEAVSTAGNISFDYSSVKNWSTYKNEMLDFINGNLDTSKNRLINNEEDNTFLIDHTGLRGSSHLDGASTKKGIWLTADTMAFTDDNWETVKTAVGLIGDTGKYGINAEVLIGKAIFGSNLTIQNEAGSMTMDGNGLVVQSAYNKIILSPSDGIKITDKNNNNKFYADSSGNLILVGKMTANGGSIGGFNISETSISSPNGNIVLNSDGTGKIGMVDIGTSSTTFNGNIYAKNIQYGGSAGTLNGDAITGSSITASQIKGGTITADEIKGNTITAAEIKDSTITAGKIGSNQISYGSSCVDSSSFDAEFNTIIANKGYITEARVKTLIADSAQINWLQGEPTYQNGYYKVNVNGSLETSISLICNTGLTSRGWLQVDGNATIDGTITAGGTVSVGGNLRLYTAGTWKTVQISGATGGTVPTTGHALYVIL